MKKLFSKLRKLDLAFMLLFLWAAATMFLWLLGAERGFSKVASEWVTTPLVPAHAAFLSFLVLRVFILPVLFCVLSGAVPFFYWGKEKRRSAFAFCGFFFCLYVLWQFTLGMDLIVNVTTL